MWAETKPFELLHTGLPRGGSCGKPHKTDVDGFALFEGDAVDDEGLGKAGHLIVGIAHIGGDVLQVPIAWFGIAVVPFVGQCGLPFVKLVIAHGADMDAHVFEGLGKERLLARCIVEEATAKVVACRHSDVVGIDALQAVERFHQGGSTRYIQVSFWKKARMKVVDGQNGYGYNVGGLRHTHGAREEQREIEYGRFHR